MWGEDGTAIFNLPSLGGLIQIILRVHLLVAFGSPDAVG